MKVKLFIKMLLSYLTIVLLSFLILNSFIKDELQKVLTGKMEREMLAYARLIDMKSSRAIKEHLSQLALISQCRLTLIDAQGRVLADSRLDAANLDNHSNRPEIQEARVRGTGKASRFSASDNAESFYVAVQFQHEGKLAGYIRLSRTLDEIKQSVSEIYYYFLMALMLTSIFSVILALVFSYYLTRPIRILEHFAERLRHDGPSGTLILQSSDETKKLAETINYLVDELQAKIRLVNEEKSKLMAALTSMTEGVLILDALDKIEFVSPALANILADCDREMEGKTLMEVFRNADLFKVFNQFKLLRKSVSAEITMGGIEPVILDISISAIHGYPDEEKAMIVFHDVTRLKKLERVRTDFVANVTHEIRTPLTAIIGCLETLQTGALDHPEDARRFIDVMLKQAQRLNRLVEDLMTISKIELGEISLHKEELSLPEMIDSVLPLVEAKAAVKQIRIENLMPEKMPPVLADRDRLCQILVNILDNAVKFTPENGKVSISAVQKSDHVVIAIGDTGIGIPKDEIQRLGERFYRVDKTRSRELGGTGLGLSIVKHLLLAHGGKMEIESQLGKGTKVLLFFPLQKG